MIAINRLKLLIVTPPAVASVALHETLCGPNYGGVWMIGPSGDNTEQSNHHTMCVDTMHADWERVVVVRNPFDRLVSLWHKLCAKAVEPPTFAAPTFREYLDGLTRDECVDPHWMYRWSISRWLAGQTFARVLRYEQLAKDVGRLLDCPPPELIETNRSQREHAAERWNRYYPTPEFEALATPLVREDCDRFGYKYREPAP